MVRIKQLKHNPFAERVCKIFLSNSQADNEMSFEDFLDMMSTFSAAADMTEKAAAAFRIYGKPMLCCP